MTLDAVAAAPHSSYIQKQLLAELGNLEKVWSDSSKQTLLLGLPLPAMQLLLSADKLKVSQETANSSMAGPASQTKSQTESLFVCHKLSQHPLSPT